MSGQNSTWQAQRWVGRACFTFSFLVYNFSALMVLFRVTSTRPRPPPRPPSRRYLMFDPAHREDYVDYLESEGQWEQAAKQLGICVNDDDFLSPHVSPKLSLTLLLV